MDTNTKDNLVGAALALLNTKKPNSDSHEFLFEKCLYVGSKAHSTLVEAKKNPLPELEGLLVEIGSIEYNIDDLDREYLTIAYKLIDFQNKLFSYVNNSIRENENQAPDDIRKELNELSEMVKKLDTFIQEETKFAKLDSQIEKAAGMAQINLFFFSIPMQSVFDLVKAARAELEKPGNISVRYVSSLLTNASVIANEFWEGVKKTVSNIPIKYQEFTRTIRVQTSLAASKAINYVYKAKLRKIKPRADTFSQETESFALSNKREILIKFLVDFRLWNPKDVETIFNSSLFIMLFLDKSFYPFSKKVADEISQDIIFLQDEEVIYVHNYVCQKSEEVIDELSREIKRIELQTKISHESKQDGDLFG